ncbi:MAG TPA: acetyl-CoA carboxylase biotin carboxyl carrier protein [bacterium]|nr:acetyl-CoA carboxylase biotin carboxyl carrier protein [bacterium]
MSTSPEKNEGSKPEKKKKSENVPSKKIKVSSKLSIVQDVIALMTDADISELSFEQGDIKVHLRRGPGMPFATGMAPTVAAVPIVATSAASSPAVAPSAGAPTVAAENGATLNSPMVGTFYRASSPDAKPFIEEGEKIAVGQVYCIIEAMKLMNEVKSEVAGKVVKILVQNGQAVEFNQPLIVVDPS